MTAETEITGTSGVVQRRWTPQFALDLLAVLEPLRHGRGDPTFQVDEQGVVWRASTSADGPVLLRLCRDAAGTVHARAWGPGAVHAVRGVPELLGAVDDATGFDAHHEPIARARRAAPGLRLTRTGRVWDALLAAVLEQKVTNRESWRSWRELCRRFGAVPPGPAPRGMRVPPDPLALRRVADWQWHRVGVDGGRRHTLVAAARVASRLERATELGGSAGRELLTRVPGIGPWTAAEVAQRAWGDPDAVSVGDFHLPRVVGLALAGRELDDDGMLAELAPYAPQRQRAVRYLRVLGAHRPRFGPRLPLRDYRQC